MSRRLADEIRDQEDRAAARAAYKRTIKRWNSQKAAAIDLDMSEQVLSGLLSEDPDRSVTLARLRHAVRVAVELFPGKRDEILTDVVRVLFDQPTGDWISGLARPERAPVLETMDVVGKATRLAERQLQGAPQEELDQLATEVVREAREAHAAVAK